MHIEFFKVHMIDVEFIVIKRNGENIRKPVLLLVAKTGSKIVVCTISKFLKRKFLKPECLFN